MNITYSYKVVSVDAAARCMEIVYEAEGHQTMHIGARLPYEGETLEAIVASYAPVALWNERTLAIVVPELGASGQIEVLGPAAQNPVEPATVVGAQEL